MSRRGLRARLGRVFAAQVAVIGLATVVGVYVTRVVAAGEPDLLASDRGGSGGGG